MGGWPFAGRDVELACLSRLLSDPDARGVVLAGPAGVGKTRLGLELLERAAAMGLVTERVMATNTRTELPYGAVAMLLPELGRRRAAGEPAELARSLATAVLERAGGRRLALLVDDAQLLDDGSAMLIHQLAMTGSVFVIATVRTGEPAPAPVVALWKEDLADRFDLDALEDDAIEQAVSAFLGGPVAGAVIVSLTRRSRGNMLFVRELVHGALAQEALRCEAGIWHLVGELHPSDRLVELLATRLADAEPHERDVLELLAVGEPLAESELEALANEELLEQLEQRGLITTSIVDGRFSAALAHPLYGEVLRAGLSAGRLRRLTRRLAEVVEAIGSRRPDDLLRIGSWRLKCGGGEPEVLFAAATIAFDRFDDTLAEQLAQAAIEAGAGFDTQLLLAEITARQGDRAGAEAQLLRLWPIADTDDQRTRVAQARVDNAILDLRLDEAVRICDDALSVVNDASLRTVMGIRRSWAIVYTAGPLGALEAAAPLGRGGGDLAVAADSAAKAAFLARVGRISESLRVSAIGEQAHTRVRTEFHWPIALHGFFQCEALCFSGRFREMKEVATGVYQAAVREGSIFGEGLAAYQLSLALLEQGRVRSAMRFAREAATLFANSGDNLMKSQGQLVVAHLSALAGDSPAAAEAMAQFDSLNLPAIWLFRGADHTRGWVAASRGDLRLARRLFQEQAAAAERYGDRALMGAVLHDLVRIGQPKLALEGLRFVSAHMEGELSKYRVAHAEALVSRKPDRLDELSLCFGAIGADLLAAEVAADAAVLWRRGGDTRKATASEHRAASLLDRCEGAITPATGSVETRARLTHAERETAVLAGEGRSNKEIATELNVSIRTVESRLQHVYTKLGISRRADLRSQLSRLGN